MPARADHRQDFRLCRATARVAAFGFTAALIGYLLPFFATPRYTLGVQLIAASLVVLKFGTFPTSLLYAISFDVAPIASAFALYTHGNHRLSHVSGIATGAIGIVCLASPAVIFPPQQWSFGYFIVLAALAVAVVASIAGLICWSRASLAPGVSVAPVPGSPAANSPGESGLDSNSA